MFCSRMYTFPPRSFQEDVAAKFARRTTDDAAQAARERYLARKRERKGRPKPMMD